MFKKKVKKPKTLKGYSTVKELLNEYDTNSTSTVRDKLYTGIIYDCLVHIEKSISFKTTARWISFIVLLLIFIGILVITGVVMVLIILKEEIHPSDYIALFGAIGGLLGAFIKLPDRIVSFVFNKSEDKFIGDIIHDMQNFDVTRSTVPDELIYYKKTGIMKDEE